MLANFLRLILSFALPPLAVFLRRGLSIAFLFSIILTIAGWVPGVIYALYINFLSPRTN